MNECKNGVHQEITQILFVSHVHFLGYFICLIFPQFLSWVTFILQVKRDFAHMFRVSRFCYTPGGSIDLPEGSGTPEMTPRALYLGTDQCTISNKNRLKMEFSRQSADPENIGSWNVDGEILKQPKGTVHFRLNSIFF